MEDLALRLHASVSSYSLRLAYDEDQTALCYSWNSTYTLIAYAITNKTIQTRTTSRFKNGATTLCEYLMQIKEKVSSPAAAIPSR